MFGNMNLIVQAPYTLLTLLLLCNVLMFTEMLLNGFKDHFFSDLTRFRHNKNSHKLVLIKVV